MNSQIMGSVLLPMVTEGLPKVSPAVGSSPTSIFFMPVVRPKLVVKAARMLANSWRFATSSLENAELWARGAGQGLLGHLRSHRLGTPCRCPGAQSTPFMPTCSLAVTLSKHSWRARRGRGFSPDHALPSPYPWNSSSVPASTDPDLPELCQHQQEQSLLRRAPALTPAPAWKPSNLKRYWIALNPACGCSCRSNIVK